MKYIDIFELSRAKTEEKGHLTIDDLPDLKEMLKSETPKADIHWKAILVQVSAADWRALC